MTNIKLGTYTDHWSKQDKQLLTDILISANPFNDAVNPVLAIMLILWCQ